MLWEENRLLSLALLQVLCRQLSEKESSKEEEASHLAGYAIRLLLIRCTYIRGWKCHDNIINGPTCAEPA